MALHLAEVATPRPLTYDFMAKLLAAGALHIDKVAITALHQEVFYATLWVRAGNRVQEIDARPSDAINLALRVRAPIFVDPELLAQRSLTPEHTLPEAADTAMELRSFRALL